MLASTSSGEHPAHGVVGEPIPVSAVVFREGHDAVGASVVVRDAKGRKSPSLRMSPGAPGTDRWHATVVPDAPGQWTFSMTPLLAASPADAPGSLTKPCVQKMPVQTRHGVRYRYVNTCGF